ncbi:MAG: GldG family protein [Candidatus Methylomirabilales bacterium]
MAWPPSTLRRLVTHRTTRYGLNTAIAILCIVGLAALVEALSARHNLRWDLTENQRHTLSPQSAKLVRSLEEDIRALVFLQTNAVNRAQVEDLLRQYAQQSSHFTYEFVDPDRNPNLTRKYRVTSYGTIVLERGTQEERVTTPAEKEITSALIRVTRSTKPVVYFITGHGEADTASSDREGLSQVREALTEANHEVKTLLLLRAQDVPTDARVVVIAGAERNLLPVEVEALDRYLARGGRLLVLLDPFRAPQLAALLKTYGVKVGENIVIDRLSRVFGGDYLIPVVTQYESHPITRDFSLASFFPLSRSVDVEEKVPAGIRAQVLARSGPDSWGESDRAALDRGQATFDKDQDLAGPVPLATAVTIDLKTFGGGKGAKTPVGEASPTGTDSAPERQTEEAENREARIVVLGSSSLARNGYLNLSGNRDFLLNTVSWLAEEPTLIAIRPREPRFTPLILTASQASTVLWSTVILPPGAALALGVTVAIRRRRAR